MSDSDKILSKIQSYKRKFYLGLLLKGVLTSILILLSIFIFSALLEYTLWLNTSIRTILFFSIVGILLYLCYKHIVLPLLFISRTKEGVSDEEAAKYLGKYFPTISDKLLNFIQLRNNQGNSALASASLKQKVYQFESVDFSKAISLSKSLNIGKYLVIPVALIIFITIWDTSALFSSSKRIIHFNESFAPSAPFRFNLLTNKLTAFENEDYQIKVELIGGSFPKDLYLVDRSRRIKMQLDKDQIFTYTYENLKTDHVFHFEGAGFPSVTYTLNVVSRPSLNAFNVQLKFPDYIKHKNENLSNTGNINIPAGTEVTWLLETDKAQNASLLFYQNNDSSSALLSPTDNQLYNYSKTFYKNADYQITLNNEYGSNKEKLQYSINVIPDEFPSVQLNSFQDTTLYSFISLGGSISDDYGIRKLKLYYSVENADYQQINIPIDKNQQQQSYYYLWKLDSSIATQGKELKYYVQVWDNDGINGSKSSKTGLYTFKIPNRREVKNIIKESAKQTERDISQSLEDAKELKKQLQEAEQRLKGKKVLSWQDEKLLKDILKKKEELNKALKQLQEQSKLNNKQQQRFSEENKRITEKVEQLQKLMDELLDDETKALYDELQKLLEEQQDAEQIQDLMEQINHKENNLEKELELTLERFKQMKFDYEVNEKVKELKNLAKDQENLKEKSNEKNTSKEELSNQQEHIEKKFDEILEEYEELKKFGEELKNPKELPDVEDMADEAKKTLSEIKEMLEKEKRKQVQKKQEDLSNKMQEMAKNIEEMMAGMEMMMQQENLDHLRDILHNLLKLSFDQESLMNEFRSVDQSDPRFVELSQQQIKLKENSKIVKDSLESLAERVFQIQAFITRELNDLNQYMEESSEAIKERKKNDAISKQQFTMTSMNNLALLLDDVLQQMQQQMADAMSGQGKPNKGQKNMPGLSELQKQLNQKIEDLKGSGKSGRQLSEELAKMAAEQERIRKALQEAQEKFNQMEGGQKPGNGIPEKMEETELDLVNKKITDETIKRQREILTRLLEAEDALREKEMEEEREAEIAKDQDNFGPKAFEEYFKMKQKEIELLKTIPPKLYPYYKNEVNEYFKRIGNTP